MRGWGLRVGLLAVTVLLCSAGVARAADTIQYSPQVLQRVDFESPSTDMQLFQVDPNAGETTSTAASWGVGAPPHLSGANALWCAGTMASSWPKYPIPTKGIAAFNATETTDYDQSWFQYSYIEPSYGVEENINPFTVNWLDAGESQTPTMATSWQYKDYSIPTTPVWVTKSIRRDDTLGGTYPHTNAGWLRFNFRSNPYDVPFAEGASIDDVLTTAYRYSAVGGLSATRGAPHTTVQITWAAATSPSGDTPYYDVYRRDVTAGGSWQLLTTTRISDLQYTDTAADLGHAYEYTVQPWGGPVSTSDWGPLPTSAQLAPAGATTLGATLPGSATSTSAPVGTKLAITGTLRNVDNAPLTGMASQVVVQTSTNGSTWTTAGPTVATAAVEQGSGSYVSTLTVSSGVYCRMQFGGSGNYQLADSPSTLTVTLRKSNTSWAGVGFVSNPVPYNTALKLQGTLNGENSAVTGKSALVCLMSSPDNSTWTTATATIAESPSGVYTATSARLTTQGQYYRLVYLGEANYTSCTSAGLQGNWVQATGLVWSSVVLSPTTVPYGGSTTLSGNLQSTVTGTNVTSQTVVAQVSINAGSPTTVATAVETAPGHYVATIAGITNTTGYKYRLLFKASPQYGPIDYATSYMSPPTVTAATMSFANAIASPATPITGTNSTLSIDVVSQTGAPVSSTNASVTLFRSPDRSTWTTMQAGITDSPAGHYSVTASNVTSDTYYYFGLATKNAAVYTVPSASASSTILKVAPMPDPATVTTATFAGGSTSLVSVAYGGTTKITGRLSNSSGVALFGHADDVVLQSSADGSSGWTTVTPPAVSSTVESATSPGSYEIVVTTNNLVTTYYRMAYNGTGGLKSSESLVPLAISGHSAVTNWSKPQFAQPTLQYGESTAVGATLNAETGPVTGRAAGVTLQSSPNGSTGWVDTGIAVTEDTPAHYSATLDTPASSRYYRFAFAGEIALSAASSSGSALVVNPAVTQWGGLPSSPQTYAFGSTASLGAALSALGAPLAGQEAAVVLQSSATGSGGWTTIPAMIAEDAPGYYTADFAPADTGLYYRLSYAGVTGAYQPTQASAVQFVSTAVDTGWSAPTAPTELSYGATLAFSAVLSTTTPVTGESARIQLVSSTDGVNWTPVTGATVTEVDGVYSATVSNYRAVGARSFKLRFAGESLKYNASDSPSAQVTINKQVTGWTGGQISTTAVWAGIGTVVIEASLEGSADGPLPGRAVTLLSSPANDGSVWTTVGVAPVQSSASHYAFTISSPISSTDTLYRIAYAGGATEMPAAWTADKLSVSQPTLRIDHASARFVGASSYNGWTTLSALMSLEDSATTDLRGGRVILEQSYLQPIIASPFVVTDNLTPDATGRVTASAQSQILSWYRLRYPKTDSTPESMTDWFQVFPRAYLSTPGTPSRVRHNRYFSVTGKVSGVPLAVRTVTLRAYHRKTKIVKRKKTYVWVLRSTTLVRVGASAGIRPFKVNVKLKQTGYWRINASINDRYNPPATTGWRSFSAR